MSVFGRVQKSFVAVFIRKILRVTVINPENEPKPDDEKAYIVCANHSSNWDPLVLGAATTRPLRYMAKSVLFKIPLLNLLVKLFGAYPVNRDTADVNSIKTTIDILKNGESVGMYPQGRRAKGIHPEQAKLKNGVAMMALRAEVGVLPVTIITKGHKVKLFHKTILVIGKFISSEEIKLMAGDKTLSTYKIVTDEIYKVILENHKKYDTLNVNN